MFATKKAASLPQIVPFARVCGRVKTIERSDRQQFRPKVLDMRQWVLLYMLNDSRQKSQAIQFP